MPAKTDPRDTSAADTYFYRRALGARDLLPAIGIGVVAGALAFYLARLYLERTPLLPATVEPRRNAKHLRRARTA
jgi:hypothetical protein